MQTSVTTLAQVAEEHGRNSVRVLVLHEEEVVHYGWRLLLSRYPWVARVFAARDHTEAVALIDRYRPTVAILDLDAGHQRIVAAIGAMMHADPDISVLLVSGRTTISAKAATFIGVTGVVRKSLAAKDLALAVRAVASGQRLFAVSAPHGAGRLSDRETEVLSLMASGATNREIASSLAISPETVKRHAKMIFRKLSVRNRTEAAERGRELGLGAERFAPQMIAC